VPKVQLPNGYWSKFDAKSDGWEENVNENFCRLDAYTGQCVIDQVATADLPATANDGDKYIDITDKTIAVWYDGQFNKFPIPCGWVFKDMSDDTYYSFDDQGNINVDVGSASVSTTTGSADAGKLIVTNIDGYFDGQLVPNISVHATTAAFETFYNRSGAGGDIFFNSTDGCYYKYSAIQGGWVSWGTVKDLTVTGTSTLTDINASGNLIVTGDSTLQGNVSIPGTGPHIVSPEFANTVVGELTDAQAATDLVHLSQRFRQETTFSTLINQGNIGYNPVNISNFSTTGWTNVSAALNLEVTGYKPIRVEIGPRDGGTSERASIGNPVNSNFQIGYAQLRLMKNNVQQAIIYLGGSDDWEAVERIYFPIGWTFYDEGSFGVATTLQYQLQARVQLSCRIYEANFAFSVMEVN